MENILFIKKFTSHRWVPLSKLRPFIIAAPFTTATATATAAAIVANNKSSSENISAGDSARDADFVEGGEVVAIAPGMPPE